MKLIFLTFVLVLAFVPSPTPLAVAQPQNSDGEMKKLENINGTGTIIPPHIIGPVPFMRSPWRGSALGLKI